MARKAPKEGGKREKRKVHWEKIRFIFSVTAVTDREMKYPISLKQARVTHLCLVWVTSIFETENSRVSLILGWTDTELSLNLLCETVPKWRSKRNTNNNHKVESTWQANTKAHNWGCARACVSPNWSSDGATASAESSHVMNGSYKGITCHYHCALSAWQQGLKAYYHHHRRRHHHHNESDLHRTAANATFTSAIPGVPHFPLPTSRQPQDTAFDSHAMSVRQPHPPL